MRLSTWYIVTVREEYRIRADESDIPIYCKMMKTLKMIFNGLLVLGYAALVMAVAAYIMILEPIRSMEFWQVNVPVFYPFVVILYAYTLLALTGLYGAVVLLTFFVKKYLSHSVRKLLWLYLVIVPVFYIAVALNGKGADKDSVPPPQHQSSEENRTFG